MRTRHAENDDCRKRDPLVQQTKCTRQVCLLYACARRWDRRLSNARVAAALEGEIGRSASPSRPTAHGGGAAAALGLLRQLHILALGFSRAGHGGTGGCAVHRSQLAKLAINLHANQLQIGQLFEGSQSIPYGYHGFSWQSDGNCVLCGLL